MNQKIVLEKCLEHSEEIVAINENEKDLQKRGLCTKCLANGYKKKHIQDSINQIKQTKQLLKEDKTNLLQSYLENMNKLNESVELLKKFYIQQIELIIISIKKWTQQIQNVEEDFINKIQSKESYDFQLFIQYIQEEQKNQIQDSIDFKVNIQNLLLSLTETDLIKKCQILLENQITKPIVFENNDKKENEDVEELNLLCEDHKKQITIFDLCKERTSQKRIGCLECLDGTIKYTSIKRAHQMWKQIQQKKLEKMNQNADVFQNKVNCLKDYLQIVQKGYISAIENTTNKLNIIYQDYSNKVHLTTNNLINTSWKCLSKEEIIKIAQDLSQINQQNSQEDPLFIEYDNQDNQINQIIKDTVLCLQECQITQFNKINGLINNLLINDNIQSYIIENTKTQQFSSIIQSKIKEQQLKPFTYNLLQNSSIKQIESCYAIAFNKDNSIVVIGCSKQIKVFEFKQEKLKQSQIINEHNDRIFTLNFMKKSNQFISGSDDDNFIIIWLMNENNEWICQQKLNGHTSYILCLVLNNNEDIIISGSADKSIKFWMKQNEWICSQTITDHTDSVYQLNMNDSQNKVISCGQDKLILIIEQSQQDQKWNIKQKINVEQFGYRICFINDNLFTFQPNSKEQMHIYEIDSNNKQYLKTKEIIVKSGYASCDFFFPQQYIKQKCLVVNKNGYNVNLIRKQQNGSFINEQSIDFGTNGLYGLMSDNGDYLITWDDKQKEIQIRKYQEK